jgi:hypothetical protein
MVQARGVHTAPGTVITALSAVAAARIARPVRDDHRPGRVGPLVVLYQADLAKHSFEGRGFGFR